MIHLIWLGCCLLGWGIIAACWLIDKRKAIAFMDAQAEVIDDRSAEVLRLRREVNELTRVAARMEASQPITVGDREADPISIEIAYFCGSEQVVLHAVHPLPNDMRCDIPSARDVLPRGVFGLAVFHDSRQIAWTKGMFDRHRRRCLSVGLADAMHIEEITDAVRRYNEAFHQSKGVEDVGVEQEGKRADRDRWNAGVARADHDHDRPGPRGQGASRD